MRRRGEAARYRKSKQSAASGVTSPAPPKSIFDARALRGDDRYRQCACAAAGGIHRPRPTRLCHRRATCLTGAPMMGERASLLAAIASSLHSRHQAARALFIRLGDADVEASIGSFIFHRRAPIRVPRRRIVITKCLRDDPGIREIWRRPCCDVASKTRRSGNRPRRPEIIAASAASVLSASCVMMMAPKSALSARPRPVNSSINFSLKQHTSRPIYRR